MNTYILADNIISPLGFDTDQNFSNALLGQTGIKEIMNENLYPKAFYGAQIDTTAVPSFSKKYTYLERLFIHSIQNLLTGLADFDPKRTVLVISTTKGNIDLLGEGDQNEFPENRVELSVMAQTISDHFKLPHLPIVISNACISGVSAILIARKLINMGKYDHAIVAGGDLLTEFTISGFQSLMAIADEPCKPYDASRKGITLGESVASLFISNNPNLAKPMALVAGGAQTNDANHISGPSRTGEGLKLAVDKALQMTSAKAANIDYISAHGTATLFNDEMEAIVFKRLELNKVPLNSLKGYFGHTLGAAGILESIMAIRQMNENTLLTSLGYENLGVSEPLAIIEKIFKGNFNTILKTVSGFGGCNAAVIFKKV